MVVQYSLSGYDQPIGVSDYQLSKAIPENLKSALPTVEEVEEELSRVIRCTEPLVITRVNPSTANEKHPDPTVKKVMGFAELNNYDDSVMLNLYAQRSTNFKGIHNKRDEILQQNNLDAIREFFKTYAELDVLVAWGNLISKRNYLLDCSRDIANVLQEQERKISWKQFLQ